MSSLILLARSSGVSLSFGIQTVRGGRSPYRYVIPTVSTFLSMVSQVGIVISPTMRALGFSSPARFNASSRLEAVG